MRVLVTGASGFLGSHICEALLQEGLQVVGASRGKGVLSEIEGVDWRFLDITDADSVENFDFSGFDAIVHNAGITFSRKPRRYLEVNYLGTKLLIDKLIRVGYQGRFLFISSLSVHGPGRAREDDIRLIPITPYGVSKLLGEQEVRASSLDWVVLRPPVIFGERDRALVGLYKLMAKGVVLSWKPEKQLTVAYAKNVAAAVAFLLKRDVSREVYLIGDATLSWEEFAQKVMETLGVNRRVVLPLRNWMVDFVAPWVGFLRLILRLPVDRHKLEEVRANQWVVESRKLIEEGFNPPFELEEALSRTLSWCRSKRLL